MKKIQWIGMLLLVLLLTACKKESSAEEGNSYIIYEVNKEETKVSGREILTKETDSQALLELLMDELSRAPENTDLRAAIPDMLSLESYTLSDESVILNFANNYSELSLTGEVLTRAAIVRTLTQIPDVNYVSFLVEGNPLLNRLGSPVGIMTAEQFIDNSGNEINTEEIASLNLYFANKNGDRLIKVNREVVYSSNISVEKLVVEQLISGVQEGEEAYPTINQQTKVVSVTVRDGTCYVNLNDAFLAQPNDVSADVTIYSIVNSLVELSDVNKVQILINGENDITYKESMSFSNPFERNLELVEN